VRAEPSFAPVMVDTVIHLFYPSLLAPKAKILGSLEANKAAFVLFKKGSFRPFQTAIYFKMPQFVGYLPSL